MSDPWAYAVYACFALGAAAVFFLLPRGRASRSAGVTGVLAGVMAGGVAFVAARRFFPDGGEAMFYLFSVIAVAAAARVVTHPKPVYSAVYFVVVVLAVAALLVMQDAEFLAVALVVIYAGAILVTYLFVIMLAQQPDSPAYDRWAREPFAAVLSVFLLMGAIGGAASQTAERPTRGSLTASSSADRRDPTPAALGNTAAVGAEVMTRYVTALEIAGLLLLISMIGAIALSKKRVPSERPVGVEPVLGRIGREVEPF